MATTDKESRASDRLVESAFLEAVPDLLFASMTRVVLLTIVSPHRARSFEPPQT